MPVMRRNAKRGDGGSRLVHAAEAAAEDVEAPEAADDDRQVAVWDEAWEQPEEERVARWLRARISQDAHAPLGERIDPFAAPARRFDADSELHRRDLVAAVGIAETRLGDGRREAMEARSAMEAELRALEERRQRLKAGLDAQQAEFDHVVAEHAVMLARLEDHVAGLEAKVAALEADCATAETEADRARAAGQQRVTELEERAAALEERRQHLAATTQAEYAEAEAAHQDWSAEAARLEGEIDAFEAYRNELVAAVEAERAEALAAGRAQEVKAARLQAGIRQLEAVAGLAGDPAPAPTALAPGDPAPVESAHAAGAVPAPAPGPGAPAGPSNGSLDPSGRLAAAMAELGRHTAAVLDAERAREDRLAWEQQQARLRLDAESQWVGSQHPGKGEPAAGGRRGSRYRRRRPSG